MLVYTDSVGYARDITGQPADSWSAVAPFPDDIRPLAETAFDGKVVRQSTMGSDSRWKHLFVVARAGDSHYDTLIDLARRTGGMPDGVLFLAGSGDQFHGFKGRAWTASPGNIHLSAWLTPARPVKRPGTSFTVLAAVAVLDAIDAVPGLHGRAGIKWVNDILIDEPKVAGVLAYTHGDGERIDGVVLGIGMNVERDPIVEPTPFVPRASSLRSCSPSPERCTQQLVFAQLIDALDRNYRTLLDGGHAALLDRYRQRSLVIGREVSICTEDSGADPAVVATGRVRGLGDDLELTLEGFEEPFGKGRLILEERWAHLTCS